jgi:hypothetical protein
MAGGGGGSLSTRRQLRRIQEMVSDVSALRGFFSFHATILLRAAGKTTNELGCYIELVHLVRGRAAYCDVLFLFLSSCNVSLIGWSSSLRPISGMLHS